MPHLRSAAALGALLCLLHGAARADDEPASQPARPRRHAAAPASPTAYPHDGQVGLYAQFGYGYRAIFRYQGNDFCGEAGKSACTGAEPAYVELGLDYAVSNQVEVLMDVRFGIGDDIHPDTSAAKPPKQLVFAPGLRIYLEDIGITKFFTTFQLAIDRTDYSASNVAGSVDLGLRNVNGLMIDVHHTFGIYVHVGETFSFVRWLELALDAGIGVQARFP